MFGKVDGAKVLSNARKALESLDLSYETREDGSIVLSAMGDDNPIGMAMIADDTNLTLNIYCYLMFDIPEDARNKLSLSLPTNSEIMSPARVITVPTTAKGVISSPMRIAEETTVTTGIM